MVSLRVKSIDHFNQEWIIPFVSAVFALTHIQTHTHTQTNSKTDTPTHTQRHKHKQTWSSVFDTSRIWRLMSVWRNCLGKGMGCIGVCVYADWYILSVCMWARVFSRVFSRIFWQFFTLMEFVSWTSWKHSGNILINVHRDVIMCNSDRFVNLWIRENDLVSDLWKLKKMSLVYSWKVKIERFVREFVNSNHPIHSWFVVRELAESR